MEHTPEPLLREVVGHLLRCERHRQGRTLAQIAMAGGVSMQHLSDVERGRKDPSSEILAAVAGALGLSVQELLREMVADAPDQPVPAHRPVALELTSTRGGTEGELRTQRDATSVASQRPGTASGTLLAAA